MRVFLYTLAGIPLLAADGILLWALPDRMAAMATRKEGWLILGGASAYVLAHAFVRKPERMYLWAHELAHLVVAKLFLRKVHGFHITSRDGGKVVIDRTNVVIDLAPYLFPLYSLVAASAAALLRSSSPWVPDIYLAAGSFLFAMHVMFSAEGFVRGQPDVTRSGRIFSLGVVLFCLLLWIPCLAAPGVEAGWEGALEAYRGWLAAGARTARRLFLYGRSLS